MKSINIDQKSIDAASAKQFYLDAIVENLGLPESNLLISCIQVGDHGYILSKAFKAGDGLLTISLEADGPLTELSSEAREEALARVLRCAAMIFSGRPHSIPPGWRPFHHKARISFQADRRSRKTGQSETGRIVMDVTQAGGPRVFAFILDRAGSQDITTFTPNMALFSAAQAGVANAVLQTQRLAPSTVLPSQLGHNIVLDESLVGTSAPIMSFTDWYEARLNTEQRRFVDHPLSGSVRLVGPAGSGKTLALVVKCLKELHADKEAGRPKRILFLTHASSTAAAIESTVLAMDPVSGVEFLASDSPELTITTLYALASRNMRYDLTELSPVSLDGYEGRALQADVLNDVIEKELKSDWISFRSRCSQPFVAYMESREDSVERRFFLWELLNEFACVLDAEGVRSGSERREKYLTDKRRAWMMFLQSRGEREVVLQIYDKFRLWLRQAKAIGSDQMIADFLNHLDSYQWEATRNKAGFDAIFVDELHLFNRQERLLFRHLMRDPNSPPAVFMAYDAKQSPRDTFLGMPGSESKQYDLWRDARLGRTEKIELVDVFRYTPQIASALTAIDQAFPGQELDSDWPAYKGISKTTDGPLPIVCELPNTITTYGVVFKRANRLQQKLSKEQRLAVLCCSYEQFKKYLNFPELRDTFYPITSRDEALGIHHSRKKFIFSMPEYVAGLQYDSVLLIDVNQNEVPGGPFSLSALRKFVSQVYLGASRAERRLEIYASLEQGGIAPMLSLPIFEGVIKRAEADDLLK